MVVRTFCTILIYILSTLYLVQSACIHDIVQPMNVPIKTVNYDNVDLDANTSAHLGNRHKRSANGRFYPIRIHMEFTDLERELSDNESSLLKVIVKKTVKKVRNILSVLPVQQPLVLKRGTSACETIWNSGINARKCAKVNPAYRGETCRDDNDNFNGFKIPDSHLEGLSVYDNMQEEPIEVVHQEGEGLRDTDYILYVQSSTTNLCVNDGDNVIAYAAFCQVDHKSRPIAGYANFCPGFIKSMGSDHSRVEAISLHEIFHALGFTRELYNQFRDCPGQNCGKRHNPVRQALGATRLVTPKVVELTSDHFGCSIKFTDNEFGAILQKKGRDVMSHWDAAFMQGSIMAPNIGLPHQTILDPITLAVFEDSGWYLVDYSQAEVFKWGKGGGCNFALPSSCRVEGQYFCKGRSHGCHFLHFDKGKCESDKFLHRCEIFKSKPEDSCLNPRRPSPPNDEEFGEDSRCFLSNLTSTSERQPNTRSARHQPESRCYQHQCVEDALQVKVGNSPWVDCSPGQNVKVPGFDGFLNCPLEGILCQSAEVTQIPEVEPEPEITQQPPSEDLPNGAIFCIEIRFRNANYNTLWKNQQLPVLKDILVQQVCDVTGITRSRLDEIQLFEGSVVFSFNLLPPKGDDEGPASEVVYNHLLALIAAGNFTVHLPPDGSMYSASDVRRTDGGPEVLSSSFPAGVIAGIVVGSVLAAAIIGILVFFVQRYYTVHAQIQPRPQDSSHRHENPHSNARRHDTPADNPERHDNSNSHGQLSRHDARAQRGHRSSAHQYGRIHLPPGYWDHNRHGQHNNYHGHGVRYSDYGERHSGYSNYSDRYSNYSSHPSYYGGSSGASVFDASQSERNSQISGRSGNHLHFPHRPRSGISTTDIVMEELDPYTLEEEDFNAV